MQANGNKACTGYFMRETPDVFGAASLRLRALYTLSRLLVMPVPELKNTYVNTGLQSTIRGKIRGKGLGSKTLHVVVRMRNMHNILCLRGQICSHWDTCFSQKMRMDRTRNTTPASKTLFLQWLVWCCVFSLCAFSFLRMLASGQIGGRACYGGLQLGAPMVSCSAIHEGGLVRPLCPGETPGCKA